jgi:adenine phosphoribosyltransferase
MEHYTVSIGKVQRQLQIVNVGAVSVALLNLLGDTELTEEAAAELAGCMPEDIDVLITPEVKAVPLAHAISRITGIPYVVARKTEKPYMVGAVKRTVLSITTGRPQELVIDGADVDRIRGRRVAIVDDVVSTGGTLDGLRELLAEIGGEVVATLVVFTEGEPRDDVVALGHLPLFPNGGGPSGG